MRHILVLMLVLIIKQRLQSYPGRRDLANSECRMTRCPREKILHAREEKNGICPEGDSRAHRLFFAERIRRMIGLILRISRSVTAPADEAVDWRPIGPAQFRKRVFCLRYICECGLRDNAPMDGGETCAAVLEAARRCLHAASITNEPRQWQQFVVPFATWRPRK